MSVDVHDAIVVLEGIVPARPMKHAIENIASVCVGVRDVENRLQITRDTRHEFNVDATTQQGSLPQRRGPKHYRRSDERIREDVCEQLMRSGHIDSSDVDVTVRECTVILDGTVPDRRTKHAIEVLADACLGVLDREQVARVIRRLDRHADRL